MLNNEDEADFRDSLTQFQDFQQELVEIPQRQKEDEDAQASAR